MSTFLGRHRCSYCYGERTRMPERQCTVDLKRFRSALLFKLAGLLVSLPLNSTLPLSVGSLPLEIGLRLSSTIRRRARQLLTASSFQTRPSEKAWAAQIVALGSRRMARFKQVFV